MRDKVKALKNKKAQTSQNKRIASWLITYLLFVLIGLTLVCAITIYLDPFMHYHKPLTDKYYYPLDSKNQRNLNDGIIKHFDYDALITGTSMVENFRTSEANRIFDARFIKVPNSGGTFKESNDSLTIALKTHPNIKIIVCSLDQYKILSNKDAMRTDLGEYPTYLYDNNPFNDVEYIFNRDVIYYYNAYMIKNKLDKQKTGITSFDSYGNWMSRYTFGQKTVIPAMRAMGKPLELSKTGILSNNEKQVIRENIEQNVTSLADQFPNTTFYYFFPPYSAAYYGFLKQQDSLEINIEITKYAASLIVPHQNIHLFSWNRFDLLDDLNNYKDVLHYGEWINSWMLSMMKKQEGRLTVDNYEQFFNALYEHYKNFDYDTLSEQMDYEADYYVAGLLNREISGTEPLKIDRNFLNRSNIKKASVVSNQYEGMDGLNCRGAMMRESGSSISTAKASYNGDYCGIKFMLDASDYRAITFYGKKIKDQGELRVYVYDENRHLLKSLEVPYDSLDNEWHQYAIGLEGIYGKVTVIFNGGYKDRTGSENSEYVFSNIVIY